MAFRAVAAGYVLLTLYYLRFFIDRQAASALVQVALLLLAAGVVLAPPSAPRASARRAWVTTLAAVGLMVGVFIWADQHSHSVSDTLNRALPALCLILALGLKLAGSAFYNRRGAQV